jgi:hypothetical protein
MNLPLSSEVSLAMISNKLSSIAALRTAGNTKLAPSTMAKRVSLLSSICGVRVSTTWFSFSLEYELMFVFFGL